MADFLQGWKQFLNENKQLDEVTEEELSDIDAILHDLKPEDLPFGNIFGDKTRLVVPMRQEDKNLTELKKLLNDSGYVPDFKTGLATYHELPLPPKYKDGRPSKTILTLTQMQTAKNSPSFFKDIRKKQIKIGKLLQKGSRLWDAAHKKMYPADSEEIKKPTPESIGWTTAKYDHWLAHEMRGGVGNVKPGSKPAEYIKAIKDWQNEIETQRKNQRVEGAKDYKKLTNVFFGAMALGGVRRGDENPYEPLATWWNKKSAFYREHPEEAEKGSVDSGYSIIYSRHPIDVLRMSDFDNITSCHSPGSRKGSIAGIEYKCAVAEAHGHGAIAYVVSNDDLDEQMEDTDYKSYQELLDWYDKAGEELFYDDAREEGVLNPTTRTRIRKYANPALEVVLGVPETRVYGTRYPEFLKQVTDWMKEQQKDIIKKVEDSKNAENQAENTFDADGDAIDLSKWERFGGSYQDTTDSGMFHHFFGYKTVGHSKWDNTTEDNLSLNSSVIDQWQEEVEEIARRWNRAYNFIKVNVEVNEYDGEAQIEWNADLTLVFDEDDFVKSAFSDETRKAIQWLPNELRDYGMDWLEDRVNYTTVNPNSNDWAELARRAVDQNGSNVVIEIPIDPLGINEEGVWSPDAFNDLCEVLDIKDDEGAQIELIAKNILQRNGVMQGGALIQLARVLEEESWYEWSYEVDDDYAPTSIKLQTKAYVNFEDLIKEIPLTLDRKPDVNSGVYIVFDGDEIAMAYQRHDGEGNFVDWEVRSPEFDHEKMHGFKDLDAVREYALWNVAQMILQPKGSKTPRGLKPSSQFSLAVKNLMREAAGGEKDKFYYPYSSLWVNGPDSDDEYLMQFGMDLTDDDPDQVVNNAHKIIEETDDEEKLAELFRTAFAKVAKTKHKAASRSWDDINLGLVDETKKYFSKFDLW
jgi:hypothetical protein